MHEDAEVAQFLRDLVGGRRQPGRDPDADVHEERAGDGQPAEEVVQAVAQQDEVAHRLAAAGAVAMAVVPVQELLQGEERAEPGQDPGEDAHGVGRARERGGDHVEERAAEQRSRGQADQRKDDPPKMTLRQDERERAHQGDRRHREAARDDPAERAHDAVPRGPRGRSMRGAARNVSPR